MSTDALADLCRLRYLWQECRMRFGELLVRWEREAESLAMDTAEIAAKTVEDAQYPPVPVLVGSAPTFDQLPDFEETEVAMTRRRRAQRCTPGRARAGCMLLAPLSPFLAHTVVRFFFNFSTSYASYDSSPPLPFCPLARFEQRNCVRAAALVDPSSATLIGEPRNRSSSNQTFRRSRKIQDSASVHPLCSRLTSASIITVSMISISSKVEGLLKV